MKNKPNATDKILFQVVVPTTKARSGTTGATIEIQRDLLKIAFHGNAVTCIWKEDLHHAWSDGMTQIFPGRQPLVAALENEGVYPPSIFVWAMETAWSAWRSGELNDRQVQAQLTSLCGWLRFVQAHRPKSRFWKQKF